MASNINSNDFKEYEFGLRLDEQNQPADHSLFRKALESAYSILKNSQNIPLRALLINTFNKAKLPAILHEKFRCIFNERFAINPPIVPEKSVALTVDGNKKWLLIRQAEEETQTESGFLNRFLKVCTECVNGILEAPVDQLIDMELLGEENAAPLTKTELFSILDYLKTKSIVLNENNIFRIFELAKYLEIKSLKEKCVDFLLEKELITADTFDKIWKICMDNPPMPQLLPLCIGFIQANLGIRGIPDNLRSLDREEIKVKDPTCIDVFYSLIISANLMSNLNFNSSDPEIKEVIKKIGKILMSAHFLTKGGRGWKINHHIKFQGSLVYLSEDNKTLSSEDKYQSKGSLSRVPGILQEELLYNTFKELDEVLKEFSLSRQIELPPLSHTIRTAVIDDCCQLTKFDFPFATKVRVIGGRSDLEMAVPNAEILDLRGCSISTVLAPRATAISLYCCSSLNKIEAPNLKQFRQEYGSKINFINTPFIRLRKINTVTVSSQEDWSCFDGDDLTKFV